MKNFAIMLLALLSTGISYSQSRVALLVGLHVSSVDEKSDLPGWDSTSKNFSSRTGFHIGVQADLRLSPFSPFYFQPGVIFYNKGRKYFATRDSSYADTDTSFATTYFDERKQFINYIDVPFNLVFKKWIGKNARLFIGGGPYISVFYSGKEQATQTLVAVKHLSEENQDLPVGKKYGQYSIFNFGVNGLAGIEFGRVSISANYSSGLNDFYKDVNINSIRHRIIGGTLAYYFDQEFPAPIKIKDRDKDGVTDDIDECPDAAGSSITNGCPDKDADGIADKNDQCPDIPGLSKYHGCPIPDSDGDGINDELDKSPSIAGLAKYNGCPVPDTDNDGINDELDKCPSIAGLAKYEGCPPPDSDGDGVNDEEDKCPDAAGTKENGGCPVIEKNIVEKINYAARRIQFQEGKAELTASSKTVLDEVAIVLQDNADLKLSIEGYSSSTGRYEINMQLSKERAKRVMEYLISKTIDATRLRADGFGPAKPLNNGKTAADRAANRRVELNLSN
jgi:OOP family OmpA-OmpF porin